MDSEKYIGLDVHQATVVVAVTDSTGKLIMESILETEAATILQFFAGLRGTLAVTFEEGTWSAAAKPTGLYAKLVGRKVTVSLSLRPVSEAPFQFVCDVIKEESMYSWRS
jgi:hypothetical protein